MLEQERATPETCLACLKDLVENEPFRAGLRAALARWDRPQAAADIAERLLNAITERAEERRSGGAHLPGDYFKANA